MAYTSEHPIIDVTVDVVCLTGVGEDRKVLLVERGSEPFQGRLALPGGFVEPDEDLEAAARRELAEETGVRMPERLEQLHTYGRPDRDPRGRTISVTHLALVADETAAQGGDDAASAGWHRVQDVLADPDRLAFDHAVILRDAVRRAEQLAG